MTDITLDRAAILFGDCLQRMRELPDACVDAVVTDPPYGLGFMGKAWDRGVAFDPATWVAVLRVLKPGGHLLAFGGTRTSHRLVCAIEDAGFEVRDSILWIYGTGFPKSLNVAKAIAAGSATSTDASYLTKWGTALKPAHEPICLARKPLEGTVAANVLEHGVGALNVDGCRIGTEDTRQVTGQRTAEGWGTRAGAVAGSALRRWPANVALSHSEECAPAGEHAFSDGFGDTLCAGCGWRADTCDWFDRAACPGSCVDDCPVLALDRQAGERSSGRMRAGTRRSTRRGSALGTFSETTGGETVGDSGGVSRFFYCSKPSRRERDLHCEALPPRSGGEATDRVDGSDGLQSPRAGAGRTGGARNFHPTLKPLELMRYLVRLVTPPDGVVLDPFAGSGTTGIAALAEGFKFVGVEMAEEYWRILEARVRGAHAW